MGGNVTHAVVKITNYTANYDGVDIRRGVERRFALKISLHHAWEPIQERWNTSHAYEEKLKKKNRLI